jgi:hypothetical protein
MKRNLKVFGLAMMVAVALSAVVASAASAHFTSSSDTTTLTALGLSIQLFATTGTAGENSEVQCTEVEVSGGTFGTEATELTIHPIYTHGICTVSIEGLGSLGAEVITNGCNYVLTTATAENIHIECETGKQIEVTAFILGKFRKCLDIHAQTPTTALVDYYNGTNSDTGKMDFDIEFTTSGITYEKTGSCAFGTIESNDGYYGGNVRLTGHDPGFGPVDVTKS